MVEVDQARFFQAGTSPSFPIFIIEPRSRQVYGLEIIFFEALRVTETSLRFKTIKIVLLFLVKIGSQAYEKALTKFLK